MNKNKQFVQRVARIKRNDLVNALKQHRAFIQGSNCARHDMYGMYVIQSYGMFICVVDEDGDVIHFDNTFYSLTTRTIQNACIKAFSISEGLTNGL